MDYVTSGVESSRVETDNPISSQDEDKKKSNAQRCKEYRKRKTDAFRKREAQRKKEYRRRKREEKEQREMTAYISSQLIDADLSPEEKIRKYLREKTEKTANPVHSKDRRRYRTIEYKAKDAERKREYRRKKKAEMEQQLEDPQYLPCSEIEDFPFADFHFLCGGQSHQMIQQSIQNGN